MYYTTTELAKELKYKNRKSCLKALHENQSSERKKKNKTLSSVWNLKIRVGKRWLFKKDEIDRILGSGNDK